MFDIKKYIPLTEEEKIRANHVDLEAFLRSHGEELERSGNECRWKRHDSVTIKGNTWYRHSAEKGGGPVKFLQKFAAELYGREMSYPEAVLELCGRTSEIVFREAESPDKKQKEKKEFIPPPRFENMHRVYAYLIKQRNIHADIISHFAKAGTLYEDGKYHNIVFAGLDENRIMRYAHKKSTYTQGKSFRGNVEGCDPRYGFSHIGNSNRVFAFEAPIDMLSYITLHKENWQQHSYITLNGVSSQALLHMLKTHSHLTSPTLCLDRDEAGQKATKRISNELEQAGYEDVSRLLPVLKDWNEDLMHLYQKPEQQQESTRHHTMSM